MPVQYLDRQCNSHGDNMTEEHRIFLNALRESGATNMFGAATFLVEAFPELSDREARAILMEWMRSF